MFNKLKSYIVPELPNALKIAEQELRLAEVDFLNLMTKVDYYISMVEFKETNIIRLRNVVNSKNVLATRKH